MPRQQNITPELYNKPFPARLRGLMEEKGLSPEDVANLIGSTRQSVNYYKNGDRVPDAETLGKLARCLMVSADYLLGITETASLNEDIQQAAKTTGLTGKAVEALQKLSARDDLVENVAALTAIDYLLLKPYFFYQVSRYLNIPQYGDFGEDDNLELKFLDDVDIPYEQKRCIVNNAWLKGSLGGQYYIGLDDPDTVIEFAKLSMQKVIIGELDKIAAVWHEAVKENGNNNETDK